MVWLDRLVQPQQLQIQGRASQNLQRGQAPLSREALVVAEHSPRIAELFGGDARLCRWIGGHGNGKRRGRRKLTTRPRVVKCRACEPETSGTAGTILHGTKTSLLVWFWAVYLVATQTSGISALELHKQLGIGDSETALVPLHKLRAARVRLDPDPIGAQGPTEMDISLGGGKHKGGGAGRRHKLPVIIAVEVRRRERHAPQTVKLVERALAGRIRLRQVQNKTAAVIETFAKDCLAPGALNGTDDGGEFETLRTCG